MTMPSIGVPAAPAVRRPPRPAAHVATVTRLTTEDATPADTVPLAAVDGTLALDLGMSPAPPAPADAPGTPELRVVSGGRDGEDVQAWAARFAQAVVEVLGGDRPLPQLVRWTSHRVYTDLGRRVRILSRTAPAAQRLRTVRPQVRSVHVFQADPDSAEVSVHVRHGNRSRAIAARLDRADGRWQCTVLQLG